MVSENGELAAFKKVTEMPDCQVHGEQFAVKCTVPRLRRIELLSEEGKRLPLAVDPLRENGTGCHVGDVGCKQDRRLGMRVVEQRGRC